MYDRPLQERCHRNDPLLRIRRRPQRRTPTCRLCGCEADPIAWSDSIDDEYPRLVEMGVIDDKEGHTKVLSGTKKERNQWVSFVVKGILGQRYYESDYWPDLVPIYWLYKRRKDHGRYWLKRKKVFPNCIYWPAALLWRIYWLL